MTRTVKHVIVIFKLQHQPIIVQRSWTMYTKQIGDFDSKANWQYIWLNGPGVTITRMILGMPEQSHYNGDWLIFKLHVADQQFFMVLHRHTMKVMEHQHNSFNLGINFAPRSIIKEWNKLFLAYMYGYKQRQYIIWGVTGTLLSPLGR